MKKTKQQKVDLKQKNVKSSSSKVRNDKQSSKVDYTHPWLIATLKGHSDQVTSFDMSPNGKYLVSCGTGRCNTETACETYCFIQFQKANTLPIKNVCWKL